jgi:peptidoglycan L-alanyl-D-glutamate endopeptidase CwlK
MTTAPAANSEMTLLWPTFAQRVQTAVAEVNKMGYPIAVFEAWRSPQRQDWLYAQGRTRPGKIVTNAKAWESAHQLGLAVDVVQMIKGKPSWEFDPAKIAQSFIDEGLEWLGPRDAYHFQLTAGIPIRALGAMARSQGVQRVWLEVGAAL